MEDLLDKESACVSDVVNVFFPRKIADDEITQEKVYKLFDEIFARWRKELFATWPAYFLYGFISDSITKLDSSIIFQLYNRCVMDRFHGVFVNRDEYHLGLNEKTKVYVNPILSILIAHDFIPSKCKRLARLSNSECGFMINEGYYPELDKLTSDEIIKSSINYLDEQPNLLNYEEIKGRKDKFKTEDALFKALKSNRIGVYIKLNSNQVVTSGKRFEFSSFASFHRKANCGNPYYMKRFAFLERLSLNHVHELWVNKKIMLHTFHMRNVMQATDIEAKFQIETTIKSYNGTNIITPDDVIFIEQEIDAYSPGKVDSLIVDFNKMPVWALVARKHADDIANERWQAGIQEITARNVCNEAATRLQKEKQFWGTRGPRTGKNVRKVALKGWSFSPSQETPTNEIKW